MLSIVDLDERDNICLSILIINFIVENGCIPALRVGTEIKYPLQEVMSRKGSLLAKPLGRLSRYLIGMENATLSYVTSCPNPHVGCRGHVLQDRNWAGSR